MAVEIMLSGVLLSILEMIVPNGKTEKVVSFAVSLVLLVMLLSPLKSAMNIDETDFDVSVKSELRDEVESALDEGEAMLSKAVEESSCANIREATIKSLMTIGIEAYTQDVHVETSIGAEVVTITVGTTKFNENEMEIIEENQSDLEVSLGTIIAQKLGMDRNMIRFYFEN